MPQADTAHLKIVMDLGGNASTGIAKLNKQVSGLGRSLGRTGKGVGQIGAGFARAGLVVGGAAVAGITAAAKAAIDFEDAYAGVRKTVNASTSELDAIALEFRKLATEIPVPATELARIGETAGALGIARDDIVEFTKVVAELAQTTNLSADVAADDLGKVTTILGLKGGAIDQFADTLVNLGNQGASTESEIIETTKRFAAMGKQVGLTTNQILALASSATSLGAEPEAAGSALSRIFGSMATNIALANGKGKAFAKVTGHSVTQLQKMINKGDGLPILLDTLKGISKMSRTEAASTLKALGITNVRDVNAVLLMAQNLGFVNKQLDIADKSKGALGKEFAKRMNTTNAQIIKLKNNLIEAGITVGTEMLPAVQRAIDKIITALQLPGTKSDLKKLGQDIGAAIDSIDWNDVIKNGREFVTVLKDGLGFAKNIFDVINALPTQVKAAAAALLVLNKASGGLIGSGVGNVVGGLAETIIRGLGSKLPGGAGRLFAQPVFVTNWPVGGLGGGGGVAGAAGKGGGILNTALKGLGVLMVAEIASEVGPQLAGLGADLGRGWRDWLNTQTGIKVPTIPVNNLQWPFGSKNTPKILPEVFGGNGLLGGTPANPTGGRHPGLDPVKVGAIEEANKKTTAAILAAKATSDAGDRNIKASTDGTKSAVLQTRSAVQVGDNHVAATVSSSVAASTGAIVGAIFAARPVVNVTNVTRTTTIQNRYAPGNGSQGQPAHDLG